MFCLFMYAMNSAEKKLKETDQHCSFSRGISNIICQPNNLQCTRLCKTRYEMVFNEQQNDHKPFFVSGCEVGL